MHNFNRFSATLALIAMLTTGGQAMAALAAFGTFTSAPVMAIVYGIGLVSTGYSVYNTNSIVESNEDTETKQSRIINSGIIAILGIIMLDEKTNTAQLNKVSDQTAKALGLTPKEQYLFNKNLPTINASLNDVMNQASKENLTLAVARARYIQDLEESLPPLAFLAFQKIGEFVRTSAGNAK